MRRASLAALAGLAACGGPGEAPAPPAQKAAAIDFAPLRLDPEISTFYRARGHQPVWVAGGALKPEARRLARRLITADADGLDPSRYGVGEIKAALAAASAGDRKALARVDLLLTRGFANYVRDLHSAPRAMRYIDEGLAPEWPDVTGALASGRPADVARLNPLHEALRRGAAAWRSANPRRSAQEEAQLRANLERTRAIPAHKGRYVVVDTGSARLWMIDGRRVEGPMRVIVGRAGMETPALAGLIRYLALNPYWNLPPDLARERAKRVLKQGPGFLARERIEILSDWGDRPRVLKPSQVNWRAVASGKIALRMRQLPGGGNMMGKMKFMLPNELGIYLHDFPDKSLFGREDRHISSGCVRVEDAERLARWLFGGAAPEARGSRPEQHADLPEPVPVYMTYLTALPDPKLGISFRADPYGRDRTQLARRGS